MLAAVWCGFAAIGAGLIHCAVAAGASAPAAVPLVAAAIVEFGWAAACLRAGRVVAPRSAMAGSAALLVGAVVMLLVQAVGFAPFLALFALQWGVALPAAYAHRTRAARRADTAPRAGLLVAVITVEAMVVAAVTTPALADTEPGDSAVPHGVLHHHGVGPR